MDDWYKVSKETVQQKGGHKLLSKYGNSLYSYSVLYLVSKSGMPGDLNKFHKDFGKVEQTKRTLWIG